MCECERMMEETIRAGVFTMCHLIASTHSALSHAAGPPPISQVIFVTLVYWKIPLIPFKEVTTVRGGEGQSGRDGVTETDDAFWRRSSQSEQTHFCPLQAGQDCRRPPESPHSRLETGKLPLWESEEENR